MQTSKVETISPKKWGVLIALYVFGCALAKGHEVGPLFFPYQYQESGYLRNISYILAAYLLIQYVLVHCLLWKTDMLLYYHLRLLKVNVYLSGCTMLIFPWLARGEIYSSIALTKHMFIYEGISMGTLLISTGIAFIKVRRAKHN